MEQLKMTFEKHKANRTPVTRERLSQVCKLVNTGLTPVEVCNQLKFSKHYFSMMIQCGMISVDGNKNYKAMERIRNERYAMFLKLKHNYVKGIRTESPRVQKLNELIEKQEKENIAIELESSWIRNTAPKIPVKPERNFIQRIIAKLFNL
jgi:hypothetical protein